MQIFSSYHPQGNSTTFCEYHNKQRMKDSIDMSIFYDGPLEEIDSKKNLFRIYTLSLDFLILNVLFAECRPCQRQSR